MVCKGGEVSFVSQMIVESLQLRDGVQWYTSMLGKFSSLSKVIEQLKEYKVDNYAVTEFIQGTRTRRWAVAWSFNDRRPSAAVSRGCKSLQKSLLPFPAEQTITVGIHDKADIAARLHDMLSKLITLWSWEPATFVGTGFCEKAVWSRASRRHLNKTNDEKSNVASKILPGDMAFGFKISFGDPEEESPGTKVVIRWLKGHDSVLFESFCGMIKRKLQDM
ncbi:similar to DUF890 domain protein [Botrytis cinerea T4]|uniref:Similar to DUF890 domain protein n=2 Tax=Botryotinia fuckeliana TaxID=40559 RepID=G2YMH4_BOTF4|nr:similar to DUF890 domain protein [Botrytis cinerea T4]